MAKHAELSEQGRIAYQEGHSFEGRVAEVYRLLHYEIQLGRIFSGRQVDLFITRRLGDLTIQRAIECKVSAVTADHIDSFTTKLRLVRREHPSALGTIISASSFTDAVKTQAEHEGIQLTLYRDLAANLIDGHAYAIGLIREIESNERYPVSLYIQPFFGYTPSGEDRSADDLISDWLSDGQWNQVTILGDVGTGKSFFCRMLAYRLAKDFLANPLDNPLPFYIDLRNSDRLISLAGLLRTHLSDAGLCEVTMDVFLYSLSQGRIVLLLDGFDEMAARVTSSVSSRNFHELASCVRGRAKVMLTCRTHYFKSRTEEEEVILGGQTAQALESARDLYWDLISRKGFRIAYLRPFTLHQIEEYVERVRPDGVKESLKKIRDTYNLMELSQRPMLLEMIVRSLDALGSNVNAARLYEVFTNAWIHRDQWREVLSSSQKLDFLMALARILWREEVASVHYNQLSEFVQEELASLIHDVYRHVEIDSEIRTASFLVRDARGYYGFAHKSYGEFFLARYVAAELEKGSTDCLMLRRLSPETISFMRDMTNNASAEGMFEHILSRPYRQFISENALMCLYGYRRGKMIESTKDETGRERLTVDLPEGVQLGGARLAQVVLEGASMPGANFSGAYLAETIFTGARLVGADLKGATLEKSDLRGCDLTSANMDGCLLLGATLERATLRNASLRDADLRECYLENAVIDGTAMSWVKSTDAVLPAGIEGDLAGGRSFTAGVLWADLGLDEEFVTRLAAEAQKSAQVVGRGVGIDPADIVSEFALQVLTDHRNRERLISLVGVDRRRYVQWAVGVIAQNLASLENRASGRDESRPRGDSCVPDNLGVEVWQLATYAERAEEVTTSEARGRQIQSGLLFDFADEYSSEFQPVNSEEQGWISRLYVDELLRYLEQVLSSEAWRTIVLRYEEELSISEIAQQTGVRDRVVQQHLRTAREILQKRFAFGGSAERLNASRGDHGGEFDSR